MEGQIVKELQFVCHVKHVHVIVRQFVYITDVYKQVDQKDMTVISGVHVMCDVKWRNNVYSQEYVKQVGKIVKMYYMILEWGMC